MSVRTCMRDPVFACLCPCTPTCVIHTCARRNAYARIYVSTGAKMLLLSLVVRSHALRPRSSIWPVFNYVPGPPLTSNFPNTAIISVIIVARSTCTHAWTTLFIVAFPRVAPALLLYRHDSCHATLRRAPPSYLNWTRPCYGLIVATLNYGPCTPQSRAGVAL